MKQSSLPTAATGETVFGASGPTDFSSDHGPGREIPDNHERAAERSGLAEMIMLLMSSPLTSGPFGVALNVKMNAELDAEIFAFRIHPTPSVTAPWLLYGRCRL